MRQTLLTGTGAYLPEKVLTNADLATFMDTDDAWIRQRTGIEKRHIVAENEMTSDLAIKAGQRALDAPNLMRLIWMPSLLRRQRLMILSPRPQPRFRQGSMHPGHLLLMFRLSVPVLFLRWILLMPLSSRARPTRCWLSVLRVSPAFLTGKIVRQLFCLVTGQGLLFSNRQIIIPAGAFFHQHYSPMAGIAISFMSMVVFLAQVQSVMCG